MFCRALHPSPERQGAENRDGEKNKTNQHNLFQNAAMVRLETREQAFRPSSRAPVGLSAGGHLLTNASLRRNRLRVNRVMHSQENAHQLPGEPELTTGQYQRDVTIVHREGRRRRHGGSDMQGEGGTPLGRGEGGGTVPLLSGRLRIAWTRTKPPPPPHTYTHTQGGGTHTDMQA